MYTREVLEVPKAVVLEDHVMLRGSISCASKDVNEFRKSGSQIALDCIAFFPNLTSTHFISCFLLSLIFISITMDNFLFFLNE
jgi:hypothetical protein